MTETNLVVATSNVQLTSEQVKEQVQLIQQVMASVMKDGTHFGTLPFMDKEAKKILYKAGAEKLSLTFRLSATYKIERLDLPNNHREYIIITTIRHIPTNNILGEGTGSCSTMESKYRYRNKMLSCPNCGKEMIIRGKEEYGGGYICWGKKGGCNAKFSDTDERIISQSIGKIENTDIADTYNTVLKIAKKRSLVDAILTVTAASDIFTQDLEENLELPPEPIQIQTKKENNNRDMEIIEQGEPSEAYKASMTDRINECADLEALRIIYNNLKENYGKTIFFKTVLSDMFMKAGKQLKKEKEECNLDIPQ